MATWLQGFNLVMQVNGALCNVKAEMHQEYLSSCSDGTDEQFLPEIFLQLSGWYVVGSS